MRKRKFRIYLPELRNWICLGLIFIFPNALQATLRPSAATFALEGSYLYLMPICNYPYFASSVNEVDTRRFANNRFANEFDFSSGYRIEGDYVLSECQYDLRARWTHLNTQSNRTLPLGKYEAAQFRLTSSTVPNSLPESDRTMNYDACDLVFGYSFFQYDSFLTINGGIHWAKIDLDENVVFLLPDNSKYAYGNFSSNMHGVGPELGLVGKWHIPFSWNTPFFLNGRWEGALLFSKINSNLNTYNPTEVQNISLTQNISNENRTYIIPHWFSSIGISMEKKFCLHLSAEIGYMVMGYYHALDLIAITTSRVSNGARTNTFDFRDTIYFHGLYVTLGITY